MKTSKLGKILVVALFVMLFTLVLTVSVNAANTNVTTADGLTTALGSAKSGDTVTVTATIPITANTTINVPEGVTVKGSVNPLLQVTGANVTLTVTGKGTISGTGNVIEAAADGVKVLLNGGTLTTTGNDNDGAIVIDKSVANATTVEINGATLTTNAGWAVNFYKNDATGTGKKVVKMTAGAINAEHVIVFNMNKADLPIDIQLTGGTITAKNTTVYLRTTHSVNSATIKLAGVAITATANDAIVNGATAGKATVTVSAGSIQTVGSVINFGGSAQATFEMSGGSIVSTRVSDNEALLNASAGTSALTAKITGGSIQCANVSLFGCSGVVNAEVSNATILCRDMVNENGSVGQLTLTAKSGASITATAAFFSNGTAGGWIVINAEVGSVLKANYLLSSGNGAGTGIAPKGTLNANGGTVELSAYNPVANLTINYNAAGTVKVAGRVMPLDFANATGAVENTTTGVKYDTLKAAIDAAADGDTVTILSGITVTEDITVGQKLTIKGVDGVSVLFENGARIVLAIGADITFDVDEVFFVQFGVLADFATKGAATMHFKGGLYSSTADIFTISDLPALTITFEEGCEFHQVGDAHIVNKYDATKENGYATTTLIFNGGYFAGAGTYMFYSRNAEDQGVYLDVTINGGEFVSTRTSGGDANMFGTTDYQGEVVVKMHGGTFRAVCPNIVTTAFRNNGLKLDVTIDETKGDVLFDGVTYLVWSNRLQTTLTVSEGTFNVGKVIYAYGPNNQDNSTITATINGGTFNCSSDFLYVADYAGKANTNKYEAAANITIDGKDVSITTAAAMFSVCNGGTLTATLKNGKMIVTNQLLYTDASATTCTLNIAGGEVYSERNDVNGGLCWISNTTNTTNINISGGKITALTQPLVGMNGANVTNAKVTVSGGEINTHSLLNENSGKGECNMTVSGGKITLVDRVFHDNGGGSKAGYLKVTMTGGEMTAQTVWDGMDTTGIPLVLTINGGTYNGGTYIKNEDAPENLVRIGTTYYTDLQAAIDAADDTSGPVTIELIGTQVMTDADAAIIINKNVIITSGHEGEESLLFYHEHSNKTAVKLNNGFDTFRVADGKSVTFAGNVTYINCGVHTMATEGTATVIFAGNVRFDNGDDGYVLETTSATGGKVVIKLQENAYLRANHIFYLGGDITQEVEISGGTIDSTTSSPIYQSKGTSVITMSGGYITGVSNAFKAAGSAVTMNLTVTGGEFDVLWNVVEIDSATATVEISGAVVKSCYDLFKVFGTAKIDKLSVKNVTVTESTYAIIETYGSATIGTKAAPAVFDNLTVTEGNYFLKATASTYQYVALQSSTLSITNSIAHRESAVAGNGYVTEVTVKSGTYTTASARAFYLGGVNNNYTYLNVNIEGGSFVLTSTESVDSAGARLVESRDGNGIVNVNISGGSFKGESAATADQDKTSLLLNRGGTLNATIAAGTVEGFDHVVWASRDNIYLTLGAVDENGALVSAPTFTSASNMFEVRAYNLDGNDARLTVKAIHGGTYNAPAGNIFYVQNDVTINNEENANISYLVVEAVNGGTFTAAHCFVSARSAGSINVTVNKGDFTTNREFLWANSVTTVPEVKLTVNGGTITASEDVILTKSGVLYLTVNGGTFTASKNFVTMTNATGTLTLNGGTVTAEAQGFLINGEANTVLTDKVTVRKFTDYANGTYTAATMEGTPDVLVNIGGTVTMTSKSHMMLITEKMDVLVNISGNAVLTANNNDTNAEMFRVQSSVKDSWKAIKITGTPTLSFEKNQMFCHTSVDADAYFDLDIDGGTFINCGNGGTHTFVASWDWQGKTYVDISGGTFKWETSVANAATPDLRFSQNAAHQMTLKISGGTFEDISILAYASRDDANSVTNVEITGGTITLINQNYGDVIYASTKGVVNVTLAGGTVNAALKDTNAGVFYTANANATINANITGGTLTNNGPVFGNSGKMTAVVSGGTVNAGNLANVNGGSFVVAITVTGTADVNLTGYVFIDAPNSDTGRISVSLEGGVLDASRLYPGNMKTTATVTFKGGIYNGATYVQNEEGVASITDAEGTHYYNSLQAAIDAVTGDTPEAPVTVTLVGGATISETVVINKNVIITGGSDDVCLLVHGAVTETFASDGGALKTFQIVAGHSVTFTGNVRYISSGFAMEESAADDVTTVTFAGKVAVDNTECASTGLYSYALVARKADAKGKLILNLQDEAHLTARHCIILYPPELTVELNISGGTLTSTESTAVYVNGVAKFSAKMTGGTINGVSNAFQILNTSSDLEITGGTFDINAAVALLRQGEHRLTIENVTVARASYVASLTDGGTNYLTIKNVTVANASIIVSLTGGSTLGSAEEPAVLENITSTTSGSIYVSDWTAGASVIHIKSGTYTVTGASVPVLSRGLDDTVVVGEESSIGDDDALVISSNGGKQAFGAHHELSKTGGNKIASASMRGKYNLTIYNGTFTANSNLIDLNEGLEGSITIHSGSFTANGGSLLDVWGSVVTDSETDEVIGYNAIDITITGGTFRSNSYFINAYAYVGTIVVSNVTVENCSRVINISADGTVLPTVNSIGAWMEAQGMTDVNVKDGVKGTPHIIIDMDNVVATATDIAMQLRGCGNVLIDIAGDKTDISAARHLIYRDMYKDASQSWQVTNISGGKLTSNDQVGFYYCGNQDSVDQLYITFNISGGEIVMTKAAVSDTDNRGLNMFEVYKAKIHVFLNITGGTFKYAPVGTVGEGEKAPDSFFFQNGGHHSEIKMTGGTVEGFDIAFWGARSGDGLLVTIGALDVNGELVGYPTFNVNRSIFYTAPHYKENENGYLTATIWGGEYTVENGYIFETNGYYHKVYTQNWRSGTMFFTVHDGTFTAKSFLYHFNGTVGNDTTPCVINNATITTATNAFYYHDNIAAIVINDITVNAGNHVFLADGVMDTLSITLNGGTYKALKPAGSTAADTAFRIFCLSLKDSTNTTRGLILNVNGGDFESTGEFMWCGAKLADVSIKAGTIVTHTQRGIYFTEKGSLTMTLGDPAAINDNSKLSMTTEATNMQVIAVHGAARVTNLTVYGGTFEAKAASFLDINGHADGNGGTFTIMGGNITTSGTCLDFDGYSVEGAVVGEDVTVKTGSTVNADGTFTDVTMTAKANIVLNITGGTFECGGYFIISGQSFNTVVNISGPVNVTAKHTGDVSMIYHQNSSDTVVNKWLQVNIEATEAGTPVFTNYSDKMFGQANIGGSGINAYFDIHINGGEFKAARPSGDVYFFQPWDGNGVMNVEILDGYFHWENPDPTVTKSCNLRGFKSHGNNMSIVLAGGKFEDMGILIWVSRGDAAYNNISISGDFVAECAVSNSAWGVLYVTGGSKLVNMHISGGTLTNINGPLLSSDTGVVNTVITGGTFHSFVSVFRVKNSYMPVEISGGSMKSTMLAEATNGGAVVIKGIENATVDVYAECANYVRFEQDGVVGYADLAGAVTYAPENAILEVIGDHTVTTTGQLKHSVTITGSGTITGSVVFINIVGPATLTFDGDVTYNGTVSIVQIPATETPFASTVNFKKGIFRVSGGSTNGAVFVDFEADSDTTVNVYEDADIRVGGWGIAFETGRDTDGNGVKTVNMYGGYLSGSHGLTFGAGGVQINLNVSGGTIETVYENFYLNNKYFKTEAQENLFEVNITGGTFISTSNTVLYETNANGTVNISGGTFTFDDFIEIGSANDISSSSLKVDDKAYHGVIKVTGGTFTGNRGIYALKSSKVYVSISDATMTVSKQIITRADDDRKGNSYADVYVSGAAHLIAADVIFWNRDSVLNVTVSADAEGNAPTLEANHIGYTYIGAESDIVTTTNFNISAGNFLATGYLFAYKNDTEGTLNISGGTMESTYNGSNNGAIGGIDAGAKATVNMTGGTITAMLIPVFGISGSTTANISGGTINCGYLVNANGTVADHKVTVSGDAVINSDISVLADGTAGSKITFNVEGGTINAPLLMTGAFAIDTVITVTGGTLNVREHTFNGAATDVVKNQTTGALYDDLQTAINEADDGDVLEILGDFVLDSGIVIEGKTITITGGTVEAPVKVLGAVDALARHGTAVYGSFLICSDSNVTFTGNVIFFESAMVLEGDNITLTLMGNVCVDNGRRSHVVYNKNSDADGDVEVYITDNATLIGNYAVYFTGDKSMTSTDAKKSVYMSGGLIDANHGLLFQYVNGVNGLFHLTGGKIDVAYSAIWLDSHNVDGKRITVILDGVTIESDDVAVAASKNADLLTDITVYAGTTVHAGLDGISADSGDYAITLETNENANPSTLIIYGGTFITETGHAAIQVTSRSAIATNAAEATGSKAYIYGGYFVGKTLSAVRASSGGYLYVYGGYFVYDSTDGNGNNPVRSGTGSTSANTATIGNVFIYGGNYVTGSVGAAFATVNELCTLEVNLAGVNANGGAYLVNAHSGIKYYADGERHLDGAIAMTDGAGVRIAEGSNGLRFVSIVTAETLAYLESIGATNVQFGTLIAPTDLVEQARSFTMADMDAAGLKYLNIPAKDGLVERAAGGYYIRAAIVNIQEGNIGREFAAVGYITYTITDANGEPVEITTYTSYREAKNARSIEQVARLALKDAELYTAAQQEILRAYAPDTEAPVIDFYLVAGQSNAAGSSYFDQSMAEINPSYKDGYANIYYSGSSNRAVRLGVPVKLGFGSGDSSFGPELGMADALSQFYNEETGRYAAIIKYAYGGTRLYDNLSGSDAVEGSWCPPSWLAVNEPLDEVRSGGLFRAFVNHIESCVADYEAMGFEVNIKSVYWMQGESDINAHAKDGLYDDIFKVWISDLRNSVCDIMDDDSYQSLPIIVGEISEYFGSNSGEAYHRNNLAFVQMQREIIGSWENVYVIPQGNVPTVDFPDDNSHWGFHEHIWNGYMVGSKMLEIAYGFQTTVSEEDAVAEVWLDGQLLGTYNNLGGAISMAPEGAVVKLLKDIELVSTLAIGNRNRITLDGCGHKIDFKPIATSVGNYSAIKCFNTDITIMNLHVVNHSKTEGDYVATYGVVLNFNAKVTWVGGYLEVERHGFVLNNAGCELTIVDGDFKLRDTSIDYAAIIFNGAANVKVTVEGGNFDCGEGTAYAVYLNESAKGSKIVLNGGTFEVGENTTTLIKGLCTTATIIVGENVELIGGGVDNIGLSQ